MRVLVTFTILLLATSVVTATPKESKKAPRVDGPTGLGDAHLPDMKDPTIAPPVIDRCVGPFCCGNPTWAKVSICTDERGKTRHHNR